MVTLTTLQVALTGMQHIKHSLSVPSFRQIRFLSIYSTFKEFKPKGAYRGYMQSTVSFSVVTGKDSSVLFSCQHIIVGQYKHTRGSMN